ncbi:F0F1 ATP synthase subunit epsilon [Palleronia sediminis]|uniref:ATP synthase epsilon chain n=1 Tax=Palleronia sediminis TaxID=2547833 RepID=A0A4R6ADE1_9RHOB|nr:F0F1 ATP synthase subunit epsilon [Palleronia sediminis]TDL81860.1 F0F1 ATP synthase subunit epsilon [Palleronia sediminis]
MADTMQFDLVSPERSVASYPARAVRIPGAEGDLTAMPGHAPLITTLRPGVLRVEADNGTEEFIVTGGFAQIDSDGVSVLAEESLPSSEMTQEVLDRMIEEAAAKRAKAQDEFQNQPGPVDDAAKLLSDMMAMGTHIGLSSKQSNL